MREILFRGKRTDNGEWVYGGILQTDNWSEISVVTDYYGSMYEPPSCEVDSYEVIPETVGQYTGLTDKNGKKIFEGDIIDTPDRLVKVVWFTSNAQFDLHFIRYKDDVTTTNFKGIYMRDLKEYEVIGNIHDNSELLEG